MENMLVTESRELPETNGQDTYGRCNQNPDQSPEFNENELDKALDEYKRRNRKFGGK